MFTTSYYSF